MSVEVDMGSFGFDLLAGLVGSLNRIMETVSGEVDSLSLRVRNAIALACVEVQS